jgi:hypothetical protein
VRLKRLWRGHYLQRATWEEDVRGLSLEELLPSVVSGTAALFGALIGAGAAILSGYLADRRRWKREDTYRDHDQRREAHLRFLSACDRIHEGETGKEMYLELKQSAQNIKLVSPSERVSDAAERLFLLLAPDTVRDGLPAMKDPDRYDALLQEFYDSAREDLGKPPLRERS